MPKKDLILCLSGGGVRAIHFHLGVIEAHRKSLPRIRAIVGVSGGAILGAYLTKNWHQFINKPDQALKSLRHWVRSAPRDRVLASSVRTAFLRNRSRSLEKMLEQLYGEVDIASCGLGATSPVPDLFVVASSLDRARPTVFGSLDGGMIWFGDGEPLAAKAPLALAVAASSAYPGLFPAIRLTPKRVKQAPGHFLPTWLTDGGIYDNSGYRVANELVRSEGENILLSDAGAMPLANPHDVRRRLGLTSTVAHAFDLVQGLAADAISIKDNDTAVSLRKFCKAEAPTVMDAATRANVGRVATDLLPLGRVAQAAVEAAGRMAAAEQSALGKGPLPEVPSDASASLLAHSRRPMVTRRTALTGVGSAAAAAGLAYFANPFGVARSALSSRRDPERLRKQMEEAKAIHVKLDQMSAVPGKNAPPPGGLPARLVNDHRRFDFRDWRSVDAQTDESLVTLTRVLSIEVDRNTTHYDAVFETSGTLSLQVDELAYADSGTPKLPSLTNRCRLYVADQISARGTRRHTVRILLNTLRRPCRLRIAMRATYINAFQGLKGQWCGMKITQSPQYASMAILWSEPKNPKPFQWMMEDRPKIPILDNIQAHLDPDKKFYYLSIVKPEPEMTVSAEWTRL